MFIVYGYQVNDDVYKSIGAVMIASFPIITCCIYYGTSCACAILYSTVPTRGARSHVTAEDYKVDAAASQAASHNVQNN